MICRWCHYCCNYRNAALCNTSTTTTPSHLIDKQMYSEVFSLETSSARYKLVLATVDYSLSLALWLGSSADLRTLLSKETTSHSKTQHHRITGDRKLSSNKFKDNNEEHYFIWALRAIICKCCTLQSRSVDGGFVQQRYSLRQVSIEDNLEPKLDAR